MLRDHLSDEWRQRLRDLRRGRQEQQWFRIVMDRDLQARLDALPPGASVVEVSGNHTRGGEFTYDRLDYPDFDLCDGAGVERTYDFVICHQVIEHVPDPFAAVAKLRALTGPGGQAFVSSALMARIHPCPDDYWRFTPSGMRVVMDRAGFRDVEVLAWGNRRAVMANLRRWTPVRKTTPWRTLGNRWDVPLAVWAVGHG